MLAVSESDHWVGLFCELVRLAALTLKKSRYGSRSTHSHSPWSFTKATACGVSGLLTRENPSEAVGGGIEERSGGRKGNKMVGEENEKDGGVESKVILCWCIMCVYT